MTRSDCGRCMRKAGMIREILLALREARDEQDKRYERSKPGSVAAAMAHASRDSYTDAIETIQQLQRKRNR